MNSGMPGNASTGQVCDVGVDLRTCLEEDHAEDLNEHMNGTHTGTRIIR